MITTLLTITLATVISMAFIGLALLPLLHRLQRDQSAQLPAYMNSAESLLDGDEPLVLYLRPFSLSGNDSQGWRVYRAVTDMVSPREVALIGRLRDIGPVVSIGFPGERTLRHYGAVRAQCPADDWQDFIRDWMARADTVVMVVNSSRSVAWQIGCLIRHGWLSRAVFVVNEEVDEPEQLLRFLRRELRGHGDRIRLQVGSCFIGFDACGDLILAREKLGYGETRQLEALARVLAARAPVPDGS